MSAGAPRDVQRLDRFDNSEYRPGSLLLRVVWTVVSGVVFQTWFPWPSRLKAALLRLFGARMGRGVVVKPRVTIKYPWFLAVGDHSWLGEGVWIDCLADVKIGSQVCVSQGVFIETGNHDWKDPSFRLLTAPVVVEDGAWLAARCTLLPGSVIGRNAVVGAGVTISGCVGEGLVAVAGRPTFRPRLP